jgi:VCBS repeat-containing protein
MIPALTRGCGRVSHRRWQAAQNDTIPSPLSDVVSGIQDATLMAMTISPPPPAAPAAHETPDAAAPADGQVPATGADAVPADAAAASTAPADATGANAALDAPPASDGAVPPVDTDGADAAGTATAPSLSGEDPADETSTHGASFGGHGSFAPLWSQNQLGLPAADDHKGIERDVPALHLFEAAGALAATSDGIDSLPNSAELHTAMAPDDSHDESSGPINSAPIAHDDAATIGEDGVLIGTSVLANDSDADNDKLRAELVDGPAHGALTLNLDGTFTYAPDADFHGSDFFTYKAVDSAGAASGAATVALTVTDINDAPAIGVDGYSVDEDGKLVVCKGGVLVNDSDAHNGAPGESNGPLTATLVEGPAHGELTLNANGTFTYTPDTDYNGSDSFTYQAVDGLGAASEAATVSIAVTSVNDAPVAAGDSYSLAEDGTLVVDGGESATVLGNDSDALGGAPDENNGPLTAELVDGPSHGSLTFNTDGTFAYAPNANYNGEDSFTYQAVDSHGAASHAATVSLTITAVNDAPVAAADSYDANHDATLSVAAKGVLANDSDVDGNTLTAALLEGPAHGSLTLNADGSFSYTPETGFDGTDSFTYHANDGKADSATTTVSLHVIDGNDYLNGTSGHDVLNGGHGNDVIYGQGSGDELNGGADDDQIYGGSNWWWDYNDGADTIDGGTGNDHVYGSTGNDSISGGDGNDYLYGNNQYSGYYYDYYYGSDDDAIDGGKGDDHIYGGNGNDTINGGEGNDYIAGNSDDDYYGYYYDNYYGDNDWIDSGAGNDTINCSSSYYDDYYGYGSSDNDTIAVSSLNGCDVIEGFDGNPNYGQDVLTLAPLFDALLVANEDRAGRVQIDNASPGIWNVNVDADGDSGNGFETMVAQIQSYDTITIGEDVLVSLAA